MLGGHGKAFCAGADLDWMRAMADYSWDENRADAQALADMLWTIYRCPLPVVGRVHGDCYAGGIGLAAVCDVRWRPTGVHFCLSEARLGLLPATIGPYVVRGAGRAGLAPLLPHRRALRRRRRRMRLGFVHEVVAAEALDAAVDEIVAALVANGPAAREGLQAAGAGRRRPRRSTRRCAPTPRAASPTSAPATRAAKACSPS